MNSIAEDNKAIKASYRVIMKILNHRLCSPLLFLLIACLISFVGSFHVPVLTHRHHHPDPGAIVLSLWRKPTGKDGDRKRLVSTTTSSSLCLPQARRSIPSSFVLRAIPTNHRDTVCNSNSNSLWKQQQQQQQQQQQLKNCVVSRNAVVSSLVVVGTFPCRIFHGSDASTSWRLWSYPPSSSQQNPEQKENEEDNSNSPEPSSVGYDGLYEFLTRRTGEQAGESERQRKRDRIMEWMKSSSSKSRNNGGSNMVQPIRLEDGKIDQELVGDKQQPPPPPPPQEPTQTKAKFDKLFAGMPSLDEILSKNADSSIEGSDGGDDGGQTTAPLRGRARDDSWFEPEKQKIQQEYQAILQDMKNKIYEQRTQDPEGIPDNAEGIVESVVNQELERMLASVKIARAKERLQDYEVSKMSDLNTKDFSGATDAVVEQILREAAEDWERKEKLKSQANDFYEYERQRRQHDKSFTGGSIGNLPQDDTDLDDWALDRLEEMLETSQNREDDDGSIADILQDNIEDLRQRIEKESKKGSIKPQTMKEWQMYRAIATRLGKQQGRDADGDVIINEGDVDEAQIARQLNSWREYVEKEDGIRKRSGLSSGPKLPFDFLGTKADRIMANDPITNVDQKKSRRELRRDVNLQAIKAMEDLIRKSDSARAEALKAELERLKAELEPRDYNDIDSEEEVYDDPALSGPVDLSDVFGRRQDENPSKGFPSSSRSQNDLAGVNRVFSDPNVGGMYDVPSNPEPAPKPPPNTPFFSESFDAEDFDRPPRKPNTPFFQDDYKSDKDDLDIENKLGSVDEQKLQAMFRRAGARTKAEQDAIRKEWEAFQAFEKERRDQSGLTENTGDSSLTGQTNLKYDISDVMKGDGDFDAEKILSSIGPRPSRKKSVGSTKDYDGNGSKEENDALASDVSPSDVADSLYRSVAAVGGGRGKENEELEVRERAEFNDYLSKEEEMRKNLDRLNDDAAELAKSMDVPVDDPGYANDILNAIGPRPTFKRTRKQSIDERKLSDMGGVLASRDVDVNLDELPGEDEDDENDDNSVISPDGSDFDDLAPAWLKKEREAAARSRREEGGSFLGSDIDELFDDDKYEHNLRQLHEYEQRRSGRKQMGIDISDIFGRRGSDDYVDYTYDTEYFRDRQDGWGEASFKARKANLLQYIELDPSELNSLMAQKESVYSTGVSQYLPRINKPFQEFGAIFRLEGVLVDITGLQQQVWKRVAGECGFKEPLLEDIRRAAVVRPEAVVREILFATNDIILVRKAVDAYRRILREEFDRWMKDQDIRINDKPEQTSNGPVEKGSLAIGFDEAKTRSTALPTSQATEEEAKRLQLLKERWTKLANQFGFPAPTNEQIAESSVLTPDIAVRSIFGWASEQKQIDQILSAYSIMQAGGSSLQSANIEAQFPRGASAPRIDPSTMNESEELSEGALLEMQFMAWKKTAEENALETPDPEEVLAAAVLNDPIAVIMSGFGWTEDPKLAATLATRYRECLAELLNGRLHSRSFAAASKTVAAKAVSEPVNSDSGPTDEEILSSQIEAWKETAVVFDFEAPSPDRIQLMMNMGPQDSVRQLLLMEYDVEEPILEEITECYSEALKKSSEKYLQRYKVSPKIQPQTSSFASAQKSKDVSGDEIYQAAFDAWTSTAWKLGFPLPDQEQVQFAMSVGPQQAILFGFHWTDSEEEAEKIAQQYLDQIRTKRDSWIKQGYTTTVKIETNTMETESLPLVCVKHGVSEWIKSLRKVDMGCGVVSYLEEDQMAVLLEYAGLSDLLPSDVRVSHSNGYQRDSQQLLGAALRIERRPDHCVVFDTSPYASVAAREMDMRSVSLVGPYPRYELQAADTSAVSVDELTAMNIRRLFGERVYDQPMLDMQNSQPETNKRVKTKYDWADD